MRKFTLLLLVFFFLLNLGINAFAKDTDKALFAVSLPEKVRVGEKTTVGIDVNKERSQGAIPSVAINWKEKPQGETPSVLVGAPESIITFKQAGKYVFEVELTLVYKNSCALASTGGSEKKTITLEVLE